MINDDTLIKIERSRGFKFNWPEQVIYMKNRLSEIKLGFPGIENDHLTLCEFKDIKCEDIFIYDIYLESGIGDEAPIMFRSLDSDIGYIEGIGCGIDSKRDPLRTKLKWQDIVKLPKIGNDTLVLRVDARPTINGGPGYYYFFKSYRDFRY